MQPRLTLGAWEAVRLRSDFSMSVANVELGFYLMVFVPGKILVRQVVLPGNILPEKNAIGRDHTCQLALSFRIQLARGDHRMFTT